MPLLVPIPQLQQDGNSSPLLVSEKPIKLSCSPVTFADGTSLTVVNQPKATFLIYRLLPGGIQEVLDDTAKAWVAPGPSVAPQNLFWNDKAKSWGAVIVAMGNQDHSSPPNNIFGTDPLTGFPKYGAQCFFTGVDSSGTSQSGRSLLSSPVEILAPGQNNLAGLTMDPQPPDPTTAQQIRIFLKNSALAELGQVTILQNGAGFHVQLVAGGSTVVLSSSGDIVLSPSNGQPVQVNGDIAVSGRVLVRGVQVAVP
jgi:hypothetical protein